MNDENSRASASSSARTTGDAPAAIFDECACTGVRWCAACLDPARRRARNQRDPIPLPRLLAEPEGPVSRFDARHQRAPGQRDFEGLRILTDVVTLEEERALLERIGRSPFLPSQSGREKQHYGPRVNFNRRRIQTDRFDGLPDYAFELEERARERIARDLPADDPIHAALAEYVTTDVFVLRYEPMRRSNLDFHLDDLFAYGDLILDFSLESDAVLSFYRGRPDGEVRTQAPIEEACVRAQLPARSLALIFGPARRSWEHALLASDLGGRRTSLTLRTIGPEVRATPSGDAILERAKRRLPDPPT